MPEYDPSLPLFSLHVPKTGGTTLYSMLPLWFPPGHILFHYPRSSSGLATRRFELGAGDILHGHFTNGNGSGLLDYYPDARQCVAFVREPFDRLVSHYFQERKVVREGIKKQWVRDFSEYYEVTVHHQRQRPVMGALNCLPSTLTLDNYRQLIGRMFVHLGVFEHFDDSIRLMRLKLSAAAAGYDVVDAPMPRTRSPLRDEEIPEEIRLRYDSTEDFALEKAIWKLAMELHTEDMRHSPQFWRL